jgi:hypothetical protein
MGSPDHPVQHPGRSPLAFFCLCWLIHAPRRKDRRVHHLRGSSGVHKERYRSFELYRRNLYEPEIVAFDELLARAEWQCTLLET